DAVEFAVGKLAQLRGDRRIGIGDDRRGRCRRCCGVVGRRGRIVGRHGCILSRRSRVGGRDLVTAGGGRGRLRGRRFGDRRSRSGPGRSRLGRRGGGRRRGGIGLGRRRLGRFGRRRSRRRLFGRRRFG